MAEKLEKAAKSLVGKLVVGFYKAPNRESVLIGVEVSGVAIIPDARGENRAYLVGVRTDAAAAGMSGIFRIGRFYDDALTIKAAKNFKPLEGLDAGQWYVVNFDEKFANVERVQNPRDVKNLPADAKNLKKYLLKQDEVVVEEAPTPESAPEAAPEA